MKYSGLIVVLPHQKVRIRSVELRLISVRFASTGGTATTCKTEGLHSNPAQYETVNIFMIINEKFNIFEISQLK